ncbi:MAG: phage tail tape measure protein, partial [Candidatus Caldatribacteriota bacterium]
MDYTSQYVLNATANVQDALVKLDQLEAKIRALSEQANALGTVFEPVTRAARRFTVSGGADLSSTIRGWRQQLGGMVEGLTKTVSLLGQSLEQVKGKGIREARKSLSEVTTSLQQVTETVKGTGKASDVTFRSMSKTMAEASQAIQQANIALEAFGAKLGAVGDTAVASGRKRKTAAKEATMAEKQAMVDIDEQLKQRQKLYEQVQKNILRRRIWLGAEQAQFAGMEFDPAQFERFFSYDVQLRAIRGRIQSLIEAQRQLGGEVYSVIPVFDRFGNKVGQFAVNIDRAGRVLINFNRGIREMFEFMFYRMGVWAVATASVYMFINAVRNGLNYIKDLTRDLALLRVAAEDIDFRSLYAGVTDLISEYGGDLQEVTKITYEFVKVLDSQREAIEATRLALIAYNISGLDYKEAATLLVGVTKQYGLTFEQLSGLIDAWALASKRGSVDFKELAQAFNQSAAAAKAAGIDYNQLTALIETVGTATGETGATLGTFIKFILEHSKDLDVLLALQEQLGIPVVKQTGEFRSVYDILVDLAKLWPQLDEGQKQYISITWASYRQGSRFKALLDSMSESIQKNNGQFKLYNEILASKGEAEYQNVIVMNTLEGQWRKLQGTYSSLIGAFSETGPLLFLRDLIMLFNSLLGVADNLWGARVILGALGAAIVMFAQKSKAAGNEIKQMVRDIQRYYKQFGTDVKTATEQAATGIQRVAQAQAQLNATMAQGRAVHAPDFFTQIGNIFASGFGQGLKKYREAMISQTKSLNLVNMASFNIVTGSVTDVIKSFINWNNIIQSVRTGLTGLATVLVRSLLQSALIGIDIMDRLRQTVIMVTDSFKNLGSTSRTVFNLITTGVVNVVKFFINWNNVIQPLKTSLINLSTVLTRSLLWSALTGIHTIDRLRQTIIAVVDSSKSMINTIATGLVTGIGKLGQGIVVVTQSFKVLGTVGKTSFVDIINTGVTGAVAGVN